MTHTKIGAGFGAASTAAEVLRGIDLSDKLALVTGGYSGIGLEATRALAGAGARVVVPARHSVRAFALQPGGIMTPLQRHLSARR